MTYHFAQDFTHAKNITFAEPCIGCCGLANDDHFSLVDEVETFWLDTNVSVAIFTSVDGSD